MWAYFFSHRFYSVNLPQDMSVAFLKNVVVSEFFLAFLLYDAIWVKLDIRIPIFCYETITGHFFSWAEYILLEFGNIKQR